jgi:hypothetical protein
LAALLDKIHGRSILSNFYTIMPALLHESCCFVPQRKSAGYGDMREYATMDRRGYLGCFGFLGSSDDKPDDDYNPYARFDPFAVANS